MSLCDKYGFPKTYEPLIRHINEFLEVNRDAEELLKDSEKVSDFILEYEAILPVNITLDYIRKRNFDEYKALRELLQNALDETELIKGEPDAEVFVDDFGTWVVDSGRGLKGEAFVIGTSDKECWMRGYYGEGMKLAVGYFLSKGFNVYIFTRDLVFKPVFYPVNSENPSIYILMGKGKREFSGTRLLIEGYNVPSDVRERVVSFKNPDLEGKLIDVVYVKGEDCNVEKPYAIYDYPNKLYIRNLLVGDMSEVTKRHSYFTYDIWWFRLDVSRELLSYTMPLLFREVSKIFDKSEKARKRLADKLIESGMVSLKKEYGGVIIEFNPVFATFEGHLFVYSFPKGIIEDLVEKLDLGERRKCVRLFTEKNTKEDIEEAVSNGIIPFLVSSEIADLSRIPLYEKGEKCV